MMHCLLPATVLLAVMSVLPPCCSAQSKTTILVDPSRKPTGPLSEQLQRNYAGLYTRPVALRRAGKQTESWEILYGTNRRASVVRGRNREYGREWGGLEVGASTVTLPRTGNKAKGRRDTTTAVTADAFRSRLRELAGRSRDRDVLIFVHGFNVDFDAAIIRTAQLVSDMPFSGAVICFAWPTQGGIRHYRRDEKIVEQSVPALAGFLKFVSESLPAETRTSILVHSMGNRAVLGALNSLESILAKQPLQHVICAAPDVAVTDFTQRIGTVTRVARRVTLYACSTDTALEASRQLHRDPDRPWVRQPRAGDATTPVIVGGVQTIDVSTVDTSFLGHSWFSTNREILTDMLHLLKKDRLPGDCRWLEPRSHKGRRYWEMEPSRVVVTPVRQWR